MGDIYLGPQDEIKLQPDFNEKKNQGIFELHWLSHLVCVWF